MSSQHIPWKMLLTRTLFVNYLISLSPYFAVLYPQPEFDLIRSSGIMLLTRPLSVNYLILLSPCFAVLYPQPEINLIRSSGIQHGEIRTQSENEINNR